MTIKKRRVLKTKRLLPKLELGGDPTSMSNLASIFGSLNGISTTDPNELRPTNNPGGKSGGGLNMSFDPVSMGLSTLTAIGGALGANMATKKAEMYADASDNLQMLDVNKITKGSGLQSFLQNPLSLGIGGRKKAELEAEEFNENMAKQLRNRNVASRFSTMSDAPTYTPVARQGGFIAYKGQTHEGSDGGILVDKFGNPTAISQEESVASVEGGGKHKKGEVSYYDPESGSTYIYSDSLKFAKPANSILNKYKLTKPESLQYQQYKNDLLTQTMVKKKFENLTTAQEFAKETESSMEDSMGMFRNGGELIKITDNRKLDMATGVPMRSTNRKHSIMDSDYIKEISLSAKKHGVDPYTALAIGLQETGFHDYYKLNPFYISNFNYDGNVIDESMKRIKSQLDLGKKLGKITDEDIIQSYNGYGTIKNQGKMYGIDTNTTPINMKENPVYGKRIVNLRDSVIKTNPKLREIIESKADGGILPMYKKGKDGDEEDLTNYQRRFLKNLRIVEKIFNPDRPYAKKLADPNQQLISHIGTTGFTIPQDREINYIDIPMGQVIKEPIEDINPTSKPRTGIGKPTIARKENLNSQRVDIPNFNMPTFGKNLSPSTKYGLMNRPQEQTLALGEEDYNSWLNPAGHMLSAAGAMADYAAMKKARPEDVSLGRVGAERISLARQRLSNTRNTASARAMASSAARSSGMNAGVVLSNTLAANTGANRLLGQQNAELLEREESANAQMRQQANIVNAELAAQEGLFNTQQQNAYRMMMAQNNPLGNLARTTASYFADNAAYQQGYDTLQMLAPNAELYRDPNAKWKNNPFARPKVRLR